MNIEEVVSRHADRLYRTAYLYLHDAMAAQDVVQEAYLQYVRRAGEVGEPGAWLRGVVRHLCLNHIRKHRREQLVDPADWPEGAAEAPDAPLADAVGRRLDVTEALLKLPVPYREVLVWRYYLDVPVKDLAAELECSAEAVRVRLHRARIALARLLHEEVVEV